MAVERFLKKLIERVIQVRAFELSAQMAFYFLLSLFPFLIFVMTLLPMLGFDGKELVELVRPYVPEEAMKIIDDNIETIFATKKKGMLSFSIVLTIWSASNAINGIVRALNHAYEIKETRSFFVSRMLAILLTLGMIVVIIVALLLPVFGKLIGNFIYFHLNLSEDFLVLWETFRWLISFCVIAFVITGLYYIGPNKRLKFREVILGGLLAAVGWLLTSYGFSYYVSNFGNYSATYGSLGGVIVLMLWFYFSAFVLLLGGIFNVVWEQRNM